MPETWESIQNPTLPITQIPHLSPLNFLPSSSNFAFSLRLEPISSFYLHSLSSGHQIRPCLSPCLTFRSSPAPNLKPMPWAALRVFFLKFRSEQDTLLLKTLHWLLKFPHLLCQALYMGRFSTSTLNIDHPGRHTFTLKLHQPVSSSPSSLQTLPNCRALLRTAPFSLPCLSNSSLSYTTQLSNSLSQEAFPVSLPPAWVRGLHLSFCSLLLIFGQTISLLWF